MFFGLWALAGALAVVGCRLFSGGSPCSTGAGLISGSYSGDQVPAKTLILLFDGGPTGATAGIGDVLQAHGVQAAFFVFGQHVESGTSSLSHLKEMGHLVANRTFSGAPLSQAIDPVTEIRKTDELIAPFVSGDIFLLRTSDGPMAEGLLKRLVSAGLNRYVGPVVADFGEQGAATQASLCWQEGRSVEDCTQLYLNGIRGIGKGIIALDGEDSRTGLLLRSLVPKLKEEGFTFVRLDQVATIRQALETSGAKPGTVGGPGGCREYER